MMGSVKNEFSLFAIPLLSSQNVSSDTIKAACELSVVFYGLPTRDELTKSCEKIYVATGKSLEDQMFQLINDVGIFVPIMQEVRSMMEAFG